MKTEYRDRLVAAFPQNTWPTITRGIREAVKIVTAKDGSYSVSVAPNAYAPKMSVRGFASETEAQTWIESKSEAWFADVCARV